MEFRIYEAGGAAAKTWDEAASRVALSDPYFLSGYARASAALDPQGRALAVHAVDGDREAIEPWIVRGRIPFAERGEGLRDAATPYGYGGPAFNVAAANNEGFRGAFYDAVDDWCRSEKIVTRFTRFHPLLENHRHPAGRVEVVGRQPTVYIDLATAIDPFDGFSGTLRAKIRKGRNAGLTVARMIGAHGFQKFRFLYEQTMDRVGASRSYYFPGSYYERLRQGLGDRVRVYGVFFEGQVIAAGVFLFGGKYGHYHLGGSDAAFFDYRPNNLLFCEVARAMKAEGIERLHLGGGTSGEDSLYRFKRSLSDKTSRFYTGHRIVDEAAYRKLTKRWEAETGRVARPGGFFPAYRAPLPAEVEVL